MKRTTVFLFTILTLMSSPVCTESGTAQGGYNNGVLNLSGKVIWARIVDRLFPGLTLFMGC